MNRDHIMDAMNYIDPAMIEAADHGTEKRRRNGWSKLAVVAACLCAVLAGTAVAAELSGVRITEFINGEFRSFNGGELEGIFSGYTVTGDVTFFPVDSLPPEIIELDQELTGSTRRRFFSWEEMEAFVGMDLMENPVLEKAAANRPINWLSRKERPCLAEIWAVQDGGISQIRLHARYTLHSRRVPDDFGSHEENVYVSVEANLFTERYEEWDTSALHGYYYREGIEVTQEDYVTPGGLYVRIFRADYPEEESVWTNMKTGETEEPITLPAASVYNAEFLLNGVMFTVRVENSSRWSGWEGDAELVRETVFEVLDGFVCEPVN